MGRTNDGSTGNYLNLGDITAKFDKDADWTFLAFFRSTDIITDDNGIVGKWGAGAEQFILRVDKTASGSAPFEVWSGTALRITGGLNVAPDTWYLVAVANDGAGPTHHLFLFDMTGTALDDDVTGTAADHIQTAGVFLLARDATNDPLDGDMAHVAYIDKQMSKGEIEQYLWSPARTVAKHITDGVQFYYPLGLGSPEPDWSGNGANATVTGTPTIGPNPPTAPWYGLDSGWMDLETGAAAPAVAAKNLTLLGVG